MLHRWIMMRLIMLRSYTLKRYMIGEIVWWSFTGGMAYAYWVDVVGQAASICSILLPMEISILRIMVNKM